MNNVQFLTGGNSNDIPRREENPFSLKHFLKRDASLSGSGCTGTATITSSTATSSQGTTTTNLINHSRSTSNINGNNSINPNNNNNNNSTGKDNVSPSKSATTSSLHNNCVTGARPKIPQFQSVNTLTTESKMKRSPRFPSFDSQSSLNSEMNEDKINTTNLYHSRSNNSFNTEYPTAIPTSSSNNSSFVQRSYSNYDMDNPILELLQNSPNVYPSNRQNNNTPTMYSSNTAATGNRGGSEFSSALPDFVQDHLVMEQWYNTLGSGSPKSISPGSMDLDQLPDFAVNDGGGRLNMPFDLTYNSEGRNRNNSPTLPLDLPGNNNYPTLDIPFNLFPRRTDRRSPQLDLPPDLTENNVASNRTGELRPDQSGAESNKIQTLPDFLSDGPIHSSGRLADVTQDTPHNNSPDENSLNSTIIRLTNDNDRLRYELEDNRRNMLDQTRRIHELEKLLIPGPKRFEIFDENLEKQRTAAAQSSANKLKQQVKQLTVNINYLVTRTIFILLYLHFRRK